MAFSARYYGFTVDASNDGHGSGARTGFCRVTGAACAVAFRDPRTVWAYSSLARLSRVTGLFFRSFAAVYAAAFPDGPCTVSAANDRT
jgi:hypothetical protein